MATLVILCPNGRRQQVKASPNKILLEVLEEVCKKQGLDPSQYGLKHGRQTLDLTVLVRYANLSNNAKLELTKVSASRGEVATKIALQLESGERLERDFPPTTSLWNVLQHWNSDNDSPVQGQLLGRDGFDPVCVYLSQEFFGKTVLQQATLRSLGLRGGRAAVRLSYRVVDKTATETESGSSSGCVVQEDKQQGEMVAGEVVAMETQEIQAVIALDQTPEVNPDTKHMETQECMNVQTETETQPNNESGDGLAEEVVASNSFDNNRTAATLESPQALQTDKESVTVADATPHQPTVSTGTRVKAKQKKPVVERQKLLQFQDFKFPEETKGATVYQAAGSVMGSSPVVVRGLLDPCDRESLVFTLTGAQSPEAAIAEEVHESFFEVTADDVQSVIQNLRNESQPGGPLMTRGQREASVNQRLEHYEKTTIRVHFPDRIVLQGFFRHHEMIGALHSWVQSCLSDPNCKFELYTAPPKQVLSSFDKTLAECGLSPASIVYCGPIGPHHEINLSDALLGDLKTFREVEAFTEDRAGRVATARSPVKGQGYTNVASGSGSIQGGMTRSDKSSGKSSTSVACSGDGEGHNPSSRSLPNSKTSKNTPKWLKIGKK